jgi:pSer/pThr/pTyr-binding forkhead associated (FHA) protein
VVGRGEDVAVNIQSPAMSRHHFKVVVRDRTLWVADMGSSNGTKISTLELEKNGKVRYAAGEPIRFGDKGLYVTIQLFSTPLEKHEAADEIVADAFANAESLKATAIAEAKTLAATEQQKILDHAKQQADDMLLQAEQNIRITRENANQQIEAERSRLQAELSATKLQTSKDIVQKMEVTQKQIEMTLQQGLKAAEEKALQFEKTRRETVESEIQAVLNETRAKGRQETEAFLAKAKASMHQEAKELHWSAQEDADRILENARKSAADLLKEYRVKRDQAKAKYERDCAMFEKNLAALTQKKVAIEDQVARVNKEMHEATERRAQVMKDLTGVEQQKKDLERENIQRAEQLHGLKNDLALVSGEQKKIEASVASLQERAQTLEKKSTELKGQSRALEQTNSESQKELLKM